MPDKRASSKSKYTADRGAPGAFEGETVTRRHFMTVSGQALGGIAAAAFTLPALGFALGPVFEAQDAKWQVIGNVDDFTPDNYVPRTLTIVDGVGEAGKSTVYMRKHNPQIDGDQIDQYDRYIAVSSRCMHLGCPVRYVKAAERFVCPCHGGVYGFKGEVTGGPPVRPLDRFYTRVRGRVVEVGARYSVNSEFKRFDPRDPGEALDGIGQYLYPPRLSTSPPPPNSGQSAW